MAFILVYAYSIIIRLEVSYIRDLGYDFIRFVATLIILIWHFYTSFWEIRQNVPSFTKDTIVRHYELFSIVGIALFFTLSGALLMHSYRKNFDIKTFYKKRILRVFIPHWIAFIYGFLILYGLNDNIIKVDPIGIFISFLGLGFFPCSLIKINSIWVIGEWYTSVIIMLYFFFPLLRELFLKHKLLSTIIITCAFIANLKFKIMSDPAGYASYSNGLMCFWLGMIFDKYINNISKKLVLLISTAVILILFLLPRIQLGCYNYILIYLFSSLLFIFLYQIKATCKFIRYVCKHNYEIYLVHHRIYLVLMPVLLTKNSNNLQIFISFLVLSGLTFLVAEALKKFCFRVQNSKIINKLFCEAN